MSHRTRVLATSLIAAALVLAGCGKKADQTAADTAMSDSLLSANPVEQPQGQIEPQTGVQSGDPASAAPAPVAKDLKPAPTPTKKPSAAAPKPHAEAPSVTVPSGTELNVALGSAINSETAKSGDTWTGTLSNAVTVGSAAPFPAGSTVTGVVEAVQGAEKGDRAFLVLRVMSIQSNGTTHSIEAGADSLIAGSTRKRNVGAVAGGAAVGALLGKALGGSTKGAVIGGIIGGAAATGAVAASKGFQVDVPQGKAIVFKVLSNTKVQL